MKPTAGLSLGRQTIVFASFVIIVAGMKAAASIVVPLLCALFLMVLSLPVLHWLRRRRVPESLALVLVIFGMVLTAVAVLTVIGSSLAGFQSELGDYAARLQKVYANAKSWIGGFVEVAEKVDSEEIRSTRRRRSYELTPPYELRSSGAATAGERYKLRTRCAAPAGCPPSRVSNERRR